MEDEQDKLAGSKLIERSQRQQDGEIDKVGRLQKILVLGAKWTVLHRWPGSLTQC